MELQRELYFGQQDVSRRLSLLERIAAKFCSSPKNVVHDPSRPSTSAYPAGSPMAPRWSPIENVPSPNSWERRSKPVACRIFEDSDNENDK